MNQKITHKYLIKKFNDRWLVLLKFNNGLVTVCNNHPTYGEARYYLTDRMVHREVDFWERLDYIRKCSRSGFDNFSRWGQSFLNKYYLKTGALDRLKSM